MASLSLNKILSGSVGGVPGAGEYFGAELSEVIAASGNYVLPVGAYLVELNAHVQIEYSTDGGTTWRAMTPLGTGGFVISDGTNVRLLADATGGTARFLPVN